MANITIRDVPEEVHEDLKRRAAAKGQSLQQYLLRQLAAVDEQAALDEWVERVDARLAGSDSRIGLAEAAAAIRAERDAR